MSFTLRFLCFDPCILRLWKVFDRNILQEKYPLIPVEIVCDMYHTWFSESVVFCSVNDQSETWIADNRKKIVVSIPLARPFTVLLIDSKADSQLPTENLSLIRWR